jgi:hypothetical protein
VEGRAAIKAEVVVNFLAATILRKENFEKY